MRLESLFLQDFKNYQEAQLNFQGRVHCFLGNNGSGKTNLLEAIHYLALTKGGIHSRDALQVRHGARAFTIQAAVDRQGHHHTLACVYTLEGSKRMSEDGKEYARFSEHIGKYPLVLVAPHDTVLITGGSEQRRRLLDTILSQSDRVYLQTLATYQAVLRQRNGLLKMYVEGGTADLDLLDTYDEQLQVAGQRIHERRAAFAEEFNKQLSDYYTRLSPGQREVATLRYESEVFEKSMQEILAQARAADLSAGRTTAGVHRDDLIFLLEGRELSDFGSQGQQKTFLLAIRMVEHRFLSIQKGYPPFLLLDDIFDKLDDLRIGRMLELLRDDGFGQIFLTDARPDRSRDALKAAGLESQVFLVADGHVAAN